MHPVTFQEGQWTCQPDPSSNLRSLVAAAGPGPLQPDYPAGSAFLHNYRQWAAGNCDVFKGSFV